MKLVDYSLVRWSPPGFRCWIARSKMEFTGGVVPCHDHHRWCKLLRCFPASRSTHSHTQRSCMLAVLPESHCSRRDSMCNKLSIQTNASSPLLPPESIYSVKGGGLTLQNKFTKESNRWAEYSSYTMNVFIWAITVTSNPPLHDTQATSSTGRLLPGGRALNVLDRTGVIAWIKQSKILSSFPKHWTPLMIAGRNDLKSNLLVSLRVLGG